MKDTFYVIARTPMNGHKYLRADDPSFRYTKTLLEAAQFDSVEAALTGLARRQIAYYGESVLGNDTLYIVRVTRTTTPGTQTRRVLDHGEAAPTGATIKFAAMNPCRPLHAETVTQNGPKDLLLWDRECELTNAAARQLFAGSYDYVVRRVALLTTEPTVEYKEEVVS